MAEFGGRARFVSENFGDSKLAKRFGVTHYPAIFVDDVLVATPADFGFYGKGEAQEGGRYAPLKSAASHERFRADLSKMIELLLAGRRDDARAVAAPNAAREGDAPNAAREGEEPAALTGVAALPEVTITDLDGRRLSRSDLDGRVVLVELWATWCPPCRSTLHWVGDLKRRYGDRLAVVAIAVESDEAKVRRLTGELNLPLTWAIGTPDLVRAFGDVSAVPTLLLFDKTGRSAAAFYGAPPTLHAEAEAKLAPLFD